MKTQEKLSLLWMIIVANILLADILSAFIAFGDPSVIEIPGDPRIVMAVSAILLNIPIFMIYLSRVLKPKLNRNLNIAAAIITIIFVLGGASSLPHYIVIAAIETAVLLFIIRTAWTSN
ncbi:hypothetical protein KA529_04240 [Candidatus Saccharibacteria bacterium]|nr:hypothetical protein [Candidatus Saccharibacteria bacterium]